MSVSVRRHLRGVAASVALSALAFGAFSTASAQANVVALGACDDSVLSQPFVPWADVNSYKLAPGGDFERSASGWALSGAASVVAGSEPAGVTGTVGSSALSLARGGSAQSPATCVNAAYPSFRFFARTDTPGSAVSVTVVYQTSLGQLSIPVGVVAVSPGWSPSLPMLTGSAIPGLLSGGTAQISLRFAQLTGSSQIDDVFVDPHGFG
ncbi:MAG: hypothetical protein ACR2KV_09815 [Solirubrobacteraceae bacterium]